MIQLQLSSVSVNGHWHPKLVMTSLDHQMVMTGWDALYYIKNLFSKPDSPMITASIMEERSDDL